MPRTSLDKFKLKLDKYLETHPDAHKAQNYIPKPCNQFTGNPSNSIIDHARAETIRRPGQMLGRLAIPPSEIYCSL